MRIRIIREGKPRDAHLRALQEDYLNRVAHFVDIRVEESSAMGAARKGRQFAKSGSRTPGSRSARPAASKWLDGLRGSYKIMLDPAGRDWTSEQFAECLGERSVRGTRDLVFLVGGPQGFPAAVREEADLLLGLSRMTLTHDWACTLLLEQIYRGFTILRGYPYQR